MSKADKVSGTNGTRLSLTLLGFKVNTVQWKMGKMGKMFLASSGFGS